MNKTLEIVKFDRPPKPVERKVPLDRLWALFVRTRGDLAYQTLYVYAYFGRLFVPFMEVRPFNQESMLEWMEFLKSRKTYLGHPYGPEFINRINVRVRAFLRWLKLMGYLYNDLADLLPMLATPALKPSKMFTEAEYERIKAYCAGKPRLQVYLWLIILSYRTGMGLIDCCKLEWHEVYLSDTEPCYIIRAREKMRGKSICQIPIVPGSDVHQWLLNLKKQQPFNYKRFDGKSFVHQDAPGLYEGRGGYRIQSKFKHIFWKSGCEPGKTFRNLRNSMCSNLVNAGVQIALVCKITGHNNVKTLLRYVKPDRRALQDGMARAQQFSASQAGIGNQHTGFIGAGDGI